MIHKEQLCPRTTQPWALAPLFSNLKRPFLPAALPTGLRMIGVVLVVLVVLVLVL